jgi:hypothetical protein
MDTTMTEEKEYILTGADRCDAKCPAQARVLIKMVDGELYFCGSHFARWEEKLTSLSYEIVDERDNIPA